MATIEDRVKIKIEGYDQEAVDSVVKKFTKTLKEENVAMSGPIPLPTIKERHTIIRSPHKHKDSQETFEKRTHKRIIYAELSEKPLNALKGIKLPSSVGLSLEIETKKIN